MSVPIIRTVIRRQKKLKLISVVVLFLFQDINLKEPVDEKLVDQLNAQYYTAEVHRAAFALPAFVRKVDLF